MKQYVHKAPGAIAEHDGKELRRNGVTEAAHTAQATRFRRVVRIRPASGDPHGFRRNGGEGGEAGVNLDCRWSCSCGGMAEGCAQHVNIPLLGSLSAGVSISLAPEVEKVPWRRMILTACVSNRCDSHHEILRNQMPVLATGAKAAHPNADSAQRHGALSERRRDAFLPTSRRHKTPR